jgi:hypothetical protein
MSGSTGSDIIVICWWTIKVKNPYSWAKKMRASTVSMQAGRGGKYFFWLAQSWTNFQKRE